MKLFVVSFSRTDQFEIIVEAENEEDAHELAHKKLTEHENPEEAYLVTSYGFQHENTEEIE